MSPELPPKPEVMETPTLFGLWINAHQLFQKKLISNVNDVIIARLSDLLNSPNFVLKFFKSKS